MLRASSELQTGDAAKHPTARGTVRQQRTIQPKTSVMPRLRSPDLYRVTGEEQHVTWILVLGSILISEAPGKPVLPVSLRQQMYTKVCV